MRRDYALGKGRDVDWQMSKTEFALGLFKLGFFGHPEVLDEVFAEADAVAGAGANGKLGAPRRASNASAV